VTLCFGASPPPSPPITTARSSQTTDTEPRIQFRRHRRRRTTSRSLDDSASRRTRRRLTCDRRGSAIVDLSPRESTSWQLIFHASPLGVKCKPRPVLRTTCNIHTGWPQNERSSQFDYRRVLYFDHSLHISVNSTLSVSVWPGDVLKGTLSGTATVWEGTFVRTPSCRADFWTAQLFVETSSDRSRLEDVKRGYTDKWFWQKILAFESTVLLKKNNATRMVSEGYKRETAR